jgi:hypothetical protein
MTEYARRAMLVCRRLWLFVLDVSLLGKLDVLVIDSDMVLVIGFSRPASMVSLQP